jgi:hypothetical protein
MPHFSDRNKATKDTPGLRRHNRNQAGRPKGKIVKPIPRSNDVAVIVPIKRANRIPEQKSRRSGFERPKARKTASQRC